MTITPRDTSLSAWKLYGQLKSGVTGLLHFGGHEDKGMIGFHKQFTWDLINNDYLKREAAEPCSSAHQHKETDHVLISLVHGNKLWHRNGGFKVIVSTDIMYWMPCKDKILLQVFSRDLLLSTLLL